MDNFSQSRLEGESFEEYRLRLKAIKTATKIYKYGFMMSFENHLIYQNVKDEERRNKKSRRSSL